MTKNVFFLVLVLGCSLPAFADVQKPNETILSVPIEEGLLKSLEAPMSLRSGAKVEMRIHCENGCDDSRVILANRFLGSAGGTIVIKGQDNPMSGVFRVFTSSRARSR